MSIQSSRNISPGQPIFEFLAEFSRRHKSLEPEIEEITRALWKRFLVAMQEVHSAHAAQPRFREGAWYLRHGVAAARQDVSACAACALEAVQAVKDALAEKGIKATDLEDLADFAIDFTQRVHNDPSILSVPIPHPFPAPSPSEPPLI